MRRLFVPIVLLSACGQVLASNSDIVTAARAQVGITTQHDPSHQKLDYPGGDVSPERGVHRRVPNLMTYFEHVGFAINPAADPAGYLPGDIVA